MSALAANHVVTLMTTEFGPWPVFEEDEIKAVEQVLRSGKVNYWTGDEVICFEQEYAAAIGRKFGIALFNGTVALELALFGYDIGPGDEVIVTSRTFIASASCIATRGATPVIADVDPVSQNITAATIEKKITSKTKAVICVHLAGWPCDMDPIMELAARHNLIVIEDCAQAHGALYKGRAVGSIGHIAAFSFCQDKIMTTGGEGGILFTDDENIYKKCWAHKDHGKNYDSVYNKEHPPGFRWLHDSFGTNFRMTAMQAAIGRIQLKKLPQWVEKRRRNAAQYNQAFADLKAVRLTLPPDDIFHSYYKYYFFIKPELLKPDWSRDRIMNEICDAGIPCFSGSCSEIYLEKAFDSLREDSRLPASLRLRSTGRGNDEGGCDEGGCEGVGESAGEHAGSPLRGEREWTGKCKRLPVAEELGETSLMLLTHPTLTESNISQTIEIVKRVIQSA